MLPIVVTSEHLHHRHHRHTSTQSSTWCYMIGPILLLNHGENSPTSHFKTGLWAAPKTSDLQSFTHQMSGWWLIRVFCTLYRFYTIQQYLASFFSIQEILPRRPQRVVVEERSSTELRNMSWIVQSIAIHIFTFGFLSYAFGDCVLSSCTL